MPRGEPGARAGDSRDRRVGSVAVRVVSYESDRGPRAGLLRGDSVIDAWDSLDGADDEQQQDRDHDDHDDLKGTP